MSETTTVLSPSTHTTDEIHTVLREHRDLIQQRARETAEAGLRAYPGEKVTVVLMGADELLQDRQTVQLAEYIARLGRASRVGLTMITRVALGHLTLAQVGGSPLLRAMAADEGNLVDLCDTDGRMLQDLRAAMRWK